MFKSIIHSFILINAVWSLVFQPFFAYAQVVTDGSTNTSVVTTPNGKPMVNIAAPSGSSGLSHNKFTDYNVDKSGLILNNSRKEGHNSNLGGVLPSNPNLKNGEARVILNEVTSSRPSHLGGYTEISGNSAALIIANPNGISCVGCGFINTERTTLVTGRPDVLDGDIRGFSMGAGEISIGAGAGGLGFDAGASPADIVAGVVKISGNIFSESQINVLTGNLAYDYYNNTVSSDDSFANYLAVDTALLGGIYANRIRIVATQKGFGVNTANLMGLNNGYAANADNIEISADGRITMAGTTAAENIALKGEAVNTGTVHSDTELKLSADSFKNEGTIQSVGSADIDMAGNFLNEGTVVSSGDVQILTAGDLSNALGAEIASGGDMALVSDNFNNAGSVQAVGSLGINAQGKFDNDGKVISSSNLEILAAGDMTNVSGAEIASGGDMALVSDNFNNAGSVQAVGFLGVAAQDKFVNEGKVLSGEGLLVQAGGDINNASGAQIASDSSIALVGSSLSNSGEIAMYDSEAVLGVLVSYDISNKGSMVSSGAIELEGKNFVNNSELFGDYIYTYLTGNLTNRGDIAAWYELGLGAKNLYNYGFAESGDLFVTYLSDSLYNYKNAGLFSAGNMALYANMDVVNYLGSIVSQGDLVIAGTEGWFAANGATAIDRNYNKYENGACVAGDCYAGTISDPGGRTYEEDYELPWYEGSITDLFKQYEKTITSTSVNAPKLPTTITDDSYTAATDKNNSIQNIGGYISAGNNMSLRTDKLENLSTEKRVDNPQDLYTLERGGEEYAAYSIDYFMDYNCKNYRQCYEYYPEYGYRAFYDSNGNGKRDANENYNNNYLSPLYSSYSSYSHDYFSYMSQVFFDPKSSNYLNTRWFGIYGEVSGDALELLRLEQYDYVSSSKLESDKAGTIRAGKDMHIQADTVKNTSASIVAGNDMQILTKSLDNTRSHFTLDNIYFNLHYLDFSGWMCSSLFCPYGDGNGYTVNLYYGDDKGYYYRGGASTARYYEHGSNGHYYDDYYPDHTHHHIGGGHYDFEYFETVDIHYGYSGHIYVSRAYGAYSTEVYSNTASVISAGGDMLVNASQSVKIDDMSGHSNTTDQYIQNITGKGTQDVSGSAPVAGIDDTWQPGINQGMYKAAQPDSSYMYETRSRFVDVGAYYGSEYFMDSINFVPDSSIKLLGDAYYENELIMSEILRQTNRPYLSPVNSNIEQVKALYDNARIEQGKLGLAVGVAPTASQLAALGTDIIWYVEKTINGEKVLVPELFLCEETIAGVETGGSMLLAGGNMHIATGSLMNSGTISAGRNLTADAGSINIGQVGKLSSGENMAVLADSLSNRGAITSGGDMGIQTDGTLSNVGGSIVSGGNMAIAAGDFISETAVISSKLGKNSSETLGSEASISSGGSMSIQADNDLSIIASNVSAEGNLVMDAGNELTIGGVTATTESTSGTQSRYGYSNYSHTVSQDFTGSEISAGGGMQLTSGGDLSVIGSDISATGNLLMDAGGELTIGAAETVTEITGREGYKPLQKKETDFTGSNISSGGNMQLTSGADLSIIGSGVSAAGNLVLDAGETLEIGGVTEVTDSFVGAGSNYTHTINKDFTGSEISAGGSMLLASGDDINITGSNISATKDVVIDAGGDVKLLSGEDYDYKKTSSKSSGFMSKKTTVTIDESVENVGTSINAGGNFMLSSGGDATFAGADITAGENALLDVDGNVNVLATTDYDYHYSKTTKSSWGGLVSEETTKINMDEKLAASDITINDGLTIVSGGNTNVIGSNVASGGDMAVYTGYNLNDDGSLSESGTGGSLNVLAGYESDMEFEETIKKNYLAAVTGILTGDIDIDFSNGKFQVSTTIGEETRDMSKYTTSTAVSSTLEAGGNMNLVSAGDVNVSGSLLNIGEDLKVTAKEDINITAAENSNEARTEHEETTIKATATVGNAYVDAAYAIYGIAEATEAVADAENALDDMKALYDAGKADKKAVEDAELNLLMATTNLANATIAAAAAAAGAATAASSSYGTGMYASGGVSYESSTEFTQQNDTTYTGSEVVAGGSVEFNAGGDMLQSGSLVASLGGDVTYNIADDLRLDAVRNTVTYEDGSESRSASVSFGTNAVQANYNESKSSSKSADNVYTNSATLADGTITYNVGGDMTGAGYNAEAKHIVADVDGDMILNSMQNTGNSNNSSSSFGLGVGKGNISGNVANSKGSGSYAQTEISSIIGTESVDINVDGKLSMSGSMIASLDAEGNDLGNLNVIAGSFEYEDLRDFSENSQSGFSVGVSTGNPLGENKTPSGSTTIGFTDTGHETEGKTYATIGQGTVTIADDSDLTGLNRDTANVQETTKDMVTGALDGSVTIDNRLFTSKGRADIAEDFKNFDENVEQIGDGLRNNIVTKSIENAATDSETNLMEAVKDYIDTDKKIQETLKDYAQMMNGMTNYDSESVQNILQAVVDIAAANGGFLGDVQITDVNGNMAGLAYTSEDGTVHNIHINLAAVDLSDPEALIRVVYHETTNSTDHRPDYDVTADNRGDTAAGIFDLKNYGNIDTNQITGEEWLANNRYDPTIMSGTNELLDNLGSMGEFSFEVIHQERNLEFKIDKYVGTNFGAIGKHSSLVLIPDNPEDFAPDKLEAAGLDPKIFNFTKLPDGRLLLVVAGYGDNPSKPDQEGYWLEAQVNRGVDKEIAIIQATMPKGYFMLDENIDYSTAIPKGYQLIEYAAIQRTVMPENPDMTDTEFIYNILHNVDTYMKNTGQIPLKYHAITGNSNCNVFCNTILDFSGADPNRNKNFPGFDVGWDKYLPNYTLENPDLVRDYLKPLREIRK